MDTTEKSPEVVGKIVPLGKAEPKVYTSDDITLQGIKKGSVTLDMTKKAEALDVDKDTVVYLIYLLFKTNMIARNNLRNMIDQISKPLPDDVLKWLVNEAAKAGR